MLLNKFAKSSLSFLFTRNFVLVDLCITSQNSNLLLFFIFVDLDIMVQKHNPNTKKSTTIPDGQTLIISEFVNIEEDSSSDSD